MVWQLTVTPPPWHITYSACQRYAFCQRWDAIAGEEALQRAMRELEPFTYAARYIGRDRYGREQWRCGRPSRMRLVVDPRVARPNLARLIWVGYGVPPGRVWAP
jgi:hypothetical protein